MPLTACALHSDRSIKRYSEYGYVAAQSRRYSALASCLVEGAEHGQPVHETSFFRIVRRGLAERSVRLEVIKRRWVGANDTVKESKSFVRHRQSLNRSESFDRQCISHEDVRGDPYRIRGWHEALAGDGTIGVGEAGEDVLTLQPRIAFE
jgi:hypothetical protein